MSGGAGRFHGRIAVVTGASRGLGFATAAALGREGAQVVAVARTVGGLEELDDAVTAAGGAKPVLVPLDLTDGDGVDRMGAALFERFGKVDALVHCAAEAAPLGPLAQSKPKTREKLLALNAAATARLIQSLDLLLRQAAAPVVLHCDDDWSDRAHWGAYAASKAAARVLVAAYAAETPAVRVERVSPPPMPTALRARTHPGEDRTALTPCAEVAETLLDRLAGQ